MKYQITGKLIVLNDTQTFPSGFSKREFVLESGDKYPQSIKLEVTKDACAALDNVQLGSILTVDFNIRGNEYQGKYYVNLQAWKFNVDERGNGSASQPDTKTESGTVKSQSKDWEEDKDDEIPF